MNNYSTRKVGVVGFAGTAAQSSYAYLHRHSAVEVVLLEHRSDVEESGTARPNSRKTIPATPEAIKQEGLDLVFLATPAQVSIDLAPSCSTPERKSWISAALFGCEMLKPTRAGTRSVIRRRICLKRQSTVCRSSIATDSRRAPGGKSGCYPTAANLAIRPLIDAEVADRSRGIICDAKSGVSGAGRKPSLKTVFAK